VYLNEGTKRNLLETFSSINENIPEYEWRIILFARDWNIDALNKEKKITGTLITIMKQMGLIIHLAEKPIITKRLTI